MTKGKPCHLQFSKDYFQELRDQCATFSKEELDLVILGQIMAHHHGEDTVGERSKHPSAMRQRSRMDFFHQGRRICRATFLKLHGIGMIVGSVLQNLNNSLIGKDRLIALQRHYQGVGLTMRQHGNHKRLPHNAMSFEETKYVVRFLQNYAEANTILLPGRIPGYKRDDLQLLPSHTTKKVNKTLQEPSHQQRN